MSSSIPLTLIVACSSKNGIGKDGTLPWRLSKEMKYFLKLTTSCPDTTRNAVIMGRNTWESIPAKFRPLKGRVNIVISSRKDLLSSHLPDTHQTSSLNGAIYLLSSLDTPKIHHSFVIGGAQLYSSALELANTNRILLTRIKQPEYECDTFFPQLTQEWSRSPFTDLIKWAGVDVDSVKEQEEEGQAQWEYQMWTR